MTIYLKACLGFVPNGVACLVSPQVLFTSSAIRCAVCFILDRIGSGSVEAHRFGQGVVETDNPKSNC